jgi:hypothetical protein
MFSMKEIMLNVTRKNRLRRKIKHKWSKNGVSTHLLIPTMAILKFP